METIDSILISKAGSANEIKVDAAQAFKALRVGDKVPDISLGEIVNHPHLTKAKFSDFKGKLLILDFWSTWCSVCISLFPRMETLQKQFGDNVVILPVGFDAGKEGSIKQFLESKRNTPQALNLPCAIQKPKDTTLMALFPFSGLPHEVWIDASGRVIGITDHHAVNADNISRILNGIIPKFSVKKVTRRILPENETLLLKNRGTFGSAFAGYIDSFSTVNSFGLVYKFDSSCLSYYGINQTVYSFYKFAYRDSIPDISDKRIVVEHNGKPFYKKRADIKSTDNWSYDEFKQSNLFAYELILPASYDVKKVNQFLIDDFDKYFQIQSKVERRKTKCLALVKFPSGNYSPINTNHQGVDADRDNFTFSQRLQYSNIPVRQFIDELDNYLMTSYPIVDESNLSIVNISLPKKKQYTISEMKVELRKYGLDLIFVEREMDILVLYNVRKS